MMAGDNKAPGPSKLDNATVKPTFNRAAAPPKPVEAPKPEPKPRPPEPSPAVPSPSGPGTPHVSPQLRDPEAEQNAKKEEFKKRMLVTREFNQKARDHTQDLGR